MPERERAYLGGQRVTIIEGKIGRRGKVKVRNAFGFVEEVDAKDLTKIDPSEPDAKLKFGDPTD